MRSLGWIVVVALLALSGCGSRPPDESDPVPEPDLSELEPQVRDVLQRARDVLDGFLRDGQTTPDESATAYGRMGMVYHTYSLVPVAEVCYRNAEHLQPDNADWPYYLGRMLREENRLDPAALAFDRALELEPGNLATLIQRAQVERARGDNDRAELFYRRAQSTDPESVAALMGLGQIAIDRREFETAVDRLETALRLSPESDAIHYPLGMAYRELGEMERARDLMARRGNRMASPPDPRMDRVHRLVVGWRIHRNRGIALVDRGFYRRALVEFRKAAEAAPEEPSTRTNLGAALSRVGDLDAARQMLEESLSLDPDQAVAHYNLGTLSARAGDDAAAIERFRIALRLEPGRLDARFNLANALRRTGEVAESAEHYRRIVEEDPRNRSARLGEAFALVRLERWSDAHTRLEEAHAALPEDNVTTNALARLLAASPRNEERDGPRALVLARELVEQQPSLGHIVTLAMANAEVRDFASAIRRQQAALRAVEQSGRRELLPEIAKNLDRYRRGEPCRRPWSPEDPAVTGRPRGV